MADVLQVEKLKELMGIDSVDISKDVFVEFSLDKAHDLIFNYINYMYEEDMPIGLENIQLNLAMEVYRKENFGSTSILTNSGIVSKERVTRGDTTTEIGYDNGVVAMKSTTAGSIMNTNDLLFLYTSQLNRYRRTVGENLL